MYLQNGDLLAIIIALLGAMTVMWLFWKQNIALTKENIQLRKELTEQEFGRINL